MIACEMMLNMQPKELVAWIVEDEILRRAARAGVTKKAVIDELGPSSATFYRITSATEVRPLSLMKAAVSLGLPPNLFTLILAEDTRRIAQLPDLDETLKDYVLTEMGAKPLPKRRRQA